MISFDSTAATDLVESFAGRLADPIADEIQLATNLPAYSSALQASLVQFLATWSRQKVRPTLITFVQDDEGATAQLNNLCETLHGLAALFFAKQALTAKRDILLSIGELISRRFDELSRIEIRGTRLLLIVADDHQKAPKNAPFVRLTTKKDSEYRAQRKDVFMADFRYYLSECFRHSNCSPLGPNDSEDILAIVYELFANTEEWGASNIANKPLTDSFRGIVAEIIPLRAITSNTAARRLRFHKHLDHYLRQISEPQNAATHVYQISVFDTGVGLAQRQLGRLITATDPPADEYQNVLTCLRRHGSSSGDPTRGVGLFEAMKLLSRVKGFIQVRTGRLGLFRNFIDDPFITGESLPESQRTKEFYRGFEYLWDWDNDPEIVSPSAAVPHVARPSLDGALFNIWVPLQELQLPLFHNEPGQE